MPWPLADRDFVLSCRESIDEASLSFSSSCASVTHPAFPEDPRMVRGELVRSSWRFTAVPSGTAIRFESVVDPRGAIPRPIVQAAQRIGKDKLIASLVYTQRVLGRPPHRRFERWSEKAAARSNNSGTPAGIRLLIRSRLFAAAAGLAALARPAAIPALTLPAAAIRLAGRVALAPARGLGYKCGWLFGAGAHPRRGAAGLPLRHLPVSPGAEVGDKAGAAGSSRANRVVRESPGRSRRVGSGASPAVGWAEVMELLGRAELVEWAGVALVTGCLGLLLRRRPAVRAGGRCAPAGAPAPCAAATRSTGSPAWLVDTLIILAAPKRIFRC